MLEILLATCLTRFKKFTVCIFAPSVDTVLQELIEKFLLPQFPEARCSGRFGA